MCQARALRAAFHRAHGFGNDRRLRRCKDEGERIQITFFHTLRGALLCSKWQSKASGRCSDAWVEQKSTKKNKAAPKSRGEAGKSEVLPSDVPPMCSRLSHKSVPLRFPEISPTDEQLWEKHVHNELTRRILSHKHSTCRAKQYRYQVNLLLLH